MKSLLAESSSSCASASRAEPLRLRLSSGLARHVADDPFCSSLRHRRPVQVAPARRTPGRTAAARCSSTSSSQLGRPPRRTLAAVGRGRASTRSARRRARVVAARAAQVVANVLAAAAASELAVEVEHVLERPLEAHAALGQPDRVHVGTTRSSLARSSRGGVTAPATMSCGAEEVLVVRAAGRAVGEHERGLPAAAGAAAALRVVRRRGRDVAHVDDVELGDVDAELHRRRAEQDRQLRAFGTRRSRSSRTG